MIFKVYIKRFDKKRPINTKNPIFSNILSFAFIPDIIWPTHDLSEPVGKSYAGQIKESVRVI